MWLLLYMLLYIDQTAILSHITVLFNLIQGTTNLLSVRLDDLARQKRMLFLYLMLLFVHMNLHNTSLCIVLSHLLKYFPCFLKSSDGMVSTMAFVENKQSLL